jgi:hypothetical protein
VCRTGFGVARHGCVDIDARRRPHPEFAQVKKPVKVNARPAGVTVVHVASGLLAAAGLSKTTVPSFSTAE